MKLLKLLLIGIPLINISYASQRFERSESRYTPKQKKFYQDQQGARHNIDSDQKKEFLKILEDVKEKEHEYKEAIKKLEIISKSKPYVYSRHNRIDPARALHQSVYDEESTAYDAILEKAHKEKMEIESNSIDQQSIKIISADKKVGDYNTDTLNAIPILKNVLSDYGHEDGQTLPLDSIDKDTFDKIYNYIMNLEDEFKKNKFKSKLRTNRWNIWENIENFINDENKSSLFKNRHNDNFTFLKVNKRIIKALNFLALLPNAHQDFIVHGNLRNGFLPAMIRNSIDYKNKHTIDRINPTLENFDLSRDDFIRMCIAYDLRRQNDKNVKFSSMASGISSYSIYYIKNEKDLRFLYKMMTTLSNTSFFEGRSQFTGKDKVVLADPRLEQSETFNKFMNDFSFCEFYTVTRDDKKDGKQLIRRKDGGFHFIEESRNLSDKAFDGTVINVEKIKS